MKKLILLASLILTVSMAVGCGSASSCWTRNGSRVPTQPSYAAAPMAEAPMMMPMPQQQIYASTCNPCAAVTNACDPCGTAGVGGANYAPMSGGLPGMQ